MFFQATTGASLTQNHDAIAACLTLLLMGGVMYVFFNSKPTTQRALLRLMFQPVLTTTLLFTMWLFGVLFSLYLGWRH